MDNRKDYVILNSIYLLLDGCSAKELKLIRKYIDNELENVKRSS